MDRVGLNVPLPKYYQIKRQIYDEIQDGRLSPGDLVPPERELALSYGVSRMTTRQAISELVHEGLLYRIQGKGTYVASHKIKKEATYFTSFSEEMMRWGLTPSSEVVSMEVIQPPLEVTPFLIEESGMCYHLCRIRKADDIPMAIENAYLPVNRFPGLDRFDFHFQSLYQVLRDDYQTRVKYAKQTIRVQRLNRESLQLFKLGSGSGLLTIRAVYDHEDQLVEYAKSLYHPERYQYVSTLFTRDE